MKTIFKKMLGLALFGLLGSVGLAAEKPPAEACYRYTFTKGDFHIDLVLGPKWREENQHQQTASYYRVSKKIINKQGNREWRHCYIRSALSTHLGEVQPVDFIKFHMSELGDTLLIEEPVPNDCNAVTNYILIKKYDPDFRYYHVQYLDAKDAGGKSFTPEQELDGVAAVRSITDDTITFCFSLACKKDKDWTLKFDDLIQKEQLPRFPG
jgi:hypothetical protein